MAAAIAYRYTHLSNGNDAQHWMKACLKWVIGTVHIRNICLSLLVILEVEDITRKCTFGHITKKKGGVWLSRHTISSAPFLQSKQCLNPKMFLKQIKHIEISSQCNQTVWHVCFISVITTLSMYILGKYNFTTCLHYLNLYPTIMCAILYIY